MQAVAVVFSVHVLFIHLFFSVCVIKVAVSGDINTYVVNDLSPLTEYEVLLSAIYRDEAESGAVPALETTRKTLHEKKSGDIWLFGCLRIYRAKIYFFIVIYLKYILSYSLLH